MKTFLRWTAGLALFTVALVVVASLLLAWGWPEFSHWPGGTVWVDGEPLEWAGWAAFGSVMGWRAWWWRCWWCWWWCRWRCCWAWACPC